MSSYGHKPPVRIHGDAIVNKTTQELGQEMKTKVVFEEDQDASLGRSTTVYVHV